MRKLTEAPPFVHKNIAAMQQLIGCYVTKTLPPDGCPLCKINYLASSCHSCPWEIMTGKWCAGVSTGYNNKSLFRRLRRIIQLARWIREYRRFV